MANNPKKLLDKLFNREIIQTLFKLTANLQAYLRVLLILIWA